MKDKSLKMENDSKMKGRVNEYVHDQYHRTGL